LVLIPAQARLGRMSLDAVSSPHSKRNYPKALDDLFALCASRPLSRFLLMEWRAGTVRLSAVRKLVDEARRTALSRNLESNRFGVSNMFMVH
jgi:hypothetical protein